MLACQSLANPRSRSHCPRRFRSSRTTLKETEMKVLVLGAGGQIAHWVIALLAGSKDIQLTLYGSPSWMHLELSQRKSPSARTNRTASRTTRYGQNSKPHPSWAPT